MTDLTDLMADAWETERLRYQIRTQGGREGCWLAWADTLWDKGEIQAFPAVKVAEAHLSRLCADAQLRALRDAGYVIAPRDPTGTMLAVGYDTRCDFGEAEFIEGYEADIYRAMIAAHEG